MGNASARRSESCGKNFNEYIVYETKQSLFSIGQSYPGILKFQGENILG